MAPLATIQGTLRADGTLELDQKPNLPAGRVQVTIQALATDTAAPRGLIEVMDDVQRRQRARGYQGRSIEEMQADETARREEDEEYERRCEQLGATPPPHVSGNE
jgi:hypothetical protein